MRDDWKTFNNLHISESSKIVTESYRGTPENKHSCTNCSAGLTDTSLHSDKVRDSCHRNQPLKWLINFTSLINFRFPAVVNATIIYSITLLIPVAFISTWKYHFCLARKLWLSLILSIDKYVMYKLHMWSTESGYGLHLSGYLDNLMSWIFPHRLSPGPEDSGCNWWTSLSWRSGSTDSSSKVLALCHCTVPPDTSLKHKYCFTLKVFVPFKTKLLIYEQ